MAPVMRSAKAATLVLLATIAAAATLPLPAAAYKVAPGETCPCVQSPPAASCTTGVREVRRGYFVCQQSANGYGCGRAWECTRSASTHQCQAYAVAAPHACTKPVARDGTCPCAAAAGGGVNLRVLQSTPRTGGGKPAVPAPPPRQEPRCRSRFAGVEVNGKKLACVSAMNIGSRSARDAYQYRNVRQNGWSTYKDDFINLNFLRDEASRMYLCVTYGSHKRSDKRQERRFARAEILTAGDKNRFYAADDPASKSSYDTYKTEALYGRTRFTTRHRWADDKTDGFCIGVGTGAIVAHFTDLSLVRGVAAGNAGLPGPTGYGRVPKWAARRLQREASTQGLQYDKAGRVLPRAVQDKKWRQYGDAPDAAMKVKLTPRCNCNGF